MGLIVGHTCSGKSFHLLRLLESEFMSHFELIFFFCPTFYINETYMSWKYLKDPCVLPIDCKDEDLEDFLDRAMEESKGLKTLFIMDDLTSGHTIKKQSSLLSYLAMSGRHHNISTIVLVQQYASCAKAVREQLEWVITFMPSDEEDIDAFQKSTSEG